MSDPRTGQAGVDRDGGGIDMFPAPTAQVVSAVDTMADTARVRWAAENCLIGGLESRIGKGPLGGPVAKQYNPTAARIRELMSTLVEQSTKLAAEGTRAVPTYLNADGRAGQNFGF